jgi:hypothetical protein
LLHVSSDGGWPEKNIRCHLPTKTTKWP